MTTTTNTSTAFFFTTHGRVSGTCGHKHRTVRAATLCAQRHSRAVKARGYSPDRRVYRSDAGRFNAAGEWLPIPLGQSIDGTGGYIYGSDGSYEPHRVAWKDEFEWRERKSDV
jgi:hypothetical protein